MNNERYTTEALNAIEKARLSSVYHRQNYVGTEHLLTGLLKETEGTAAQVLMNAGITAEKVDKMIDRLIALRKKGAPLMNTASGLRRMKDMRFKKRCWVTNFVMVDGAFSPQCLGSEFGLCERCGFGMASEMAGLWNLHPETILAGLKVRM